MQKFNYYLSVELFLYVNETLIQTWQEQLVVLK